MMLGITTFICVTLLVRAAHHDHDHKHDHEHGKKFHDHGMKNHINKLKGIVTELAVGSLDEGYKIYKEDVDTLVKNLKENKVKVASKPEEETEEEKSERKVFATEAKVAVGAKLETTKFTVIDIVLRAAKHCRGANDYVFGKIVGPDDHPAKRGVEEGCLAGNPHEEELMNVLTDFEEVMFAYLEGFAQRQVVKIAELLSTATSFDFDAENAFNEEAVREATGQQTKDAVDYIEKLLTIIVATGKQNDKDKKHRDIIVERARELMDHKDMRGTGEVIHAMVDIVHKGRKSYQEIKRVVLPKKE